jgi:hypothetical protein
MLKIINQKKKHNFDEQTLPFDQDVLEEAFVHQPFLVLLEAK